MSANRPSIVPIVTIAVAVAALAAPRAAYPQEPPPSVRDAPATAGGEPSGRIRAGRHGPQPRDPHVVLYVSPGDVPLDALDRAALPAACAGAPHVRCEGVAAWGDLELATLTKDLGRYFGADRGVLVLRSGAAVPRLRDGDVIVAIGGREPQDGAHALRILMSYESGEMLTLAVLRDRRPLQLVIATPAAMHGGPPVAPPRAPPLPAVPPAPPPPPQPAPSGRTRRRRPREALC